MNKVDETAYKVQELEKRLDNHMVGGGLLVFEFKKNVDQQDISPSFEHHFLVGAYRVETTDSTVVFQGGVEVKATGDEAATLLISVRVDGYLIHDEEVVLEPGQTKTIQVVKAMPVGTIADKYIEVVAKKPSGGSAAVLGWDFFLWGYGVSIISGAYESTGNIAACLVEEGKYAIYLVVNGKGFFYYGAKDYTDFSINSFTPLGDVTIMDGAVLLEERSPSTESVATKAESGEINGETRDLLPCLYSFVVDGKNVLRAYKGESLSEEFSSVYIKNVRALSVASVDLGSKIVVVYATLRDLYYFEVSPSGVTESTLLYTFDESISEVKLIKNCLSTQFLVVGLKSGKNYLFNSVTDFASETCENTIKVELELKFDE